MATNSDLSELQGHIRNIAAVLVGIFKDKRMTVDEQVDLGIERLCEATIALTKLKRARNDQDKT